MELDDRGAVLRGLPEDQLARRIPHRVDAGAVTSGAHRFGVVEHQHQIELEVLGAA